MPQDESASREDRADEAIAAYLAAVARGEAPNREMFLAKHAEVAAEWNSFLANRSQSRMATGHVAPGSTSQNGAPDSPPKKPAFDPHEATMTFQQPDVPAARNVLQSFGDYELIQEIARGGMGVVYRARQVTLKRIVAVKMILGGHLAGPEDVQRFHTEAEAAAQLDHPGIVPIYEVGEQDGLHYFSMGFVEGQSLAKRIAEGPLKPRAAAEIAKTIAEAVQYAHDKGVIHRDLKPGNILLDKDGRPRVTDFGLAKLTDGGSDMTGTGQILGTPSYMPPEQAAGKTDQIGRPADVYALGAILYCLVTGRPPFQAASPIETLQQVLRQEPVAPRELNPLIPRDLETVCLKCLQKEPTRRYSSAHSVMEELERFLEGRPILARPISAVEKLWRWARRNRAVAAMTAALVVTVAVALVVVTAFWLRAEYHRSIAQTETARASDQATRAESQWRRAEQNLSEARRAVHEHFILVSEDDLKRVPGTHELRRKLLATALDYFRGFLKQSETDTDMQADVTTAYLLVAKITNEIGSKEDALAAAREAIAIVEGMHDLRPDDATTSGQLATGHNLAAAICLQLGQFDEADRHLRSSCDLLEKLVEDDPTATAIRAALAQAYDNRAACRAAQDRPLEALACRQQALGILQQLAQQKPADPMIRSELARVYSNHAIQYSQTGQVDQARREFQQAEKLLVDLISADPVAAEYRSSLASVYVNLAGSHRLIGNQVAAGPLATREWIRSLQFYEKGREQLQTLVSENPQVSEFRSQLALVHASIGYLHMALGNPREAETALSKAIVVREHLVVQHPQVREYAFDLARIQNTYGSMLRDTGKPADSLARFGKARRQIESWLADDGDDAEAQSFLGGILNNQAMALELLGRPVDALADYDAAIKCQRAAFDTAPQAIQYRKFLSNHLDGLARVQRRLGRPEESVATIEQRIALWLVDGNELFRAACDLAACVSLHSGDEHLDQRRRTSELAVATLRAAIANGFRDFEALKNDPQLKSIRSEPSFQELIAKPPR